MNKRSGDLHWYDVPLMLIRMISVKWWVVIVGGVVGIPTSIYGIQWMEYKFVKQNENCYSDFTQGVVRTGPLDPNQQGNAIEAKVKDYTSCVKNIDPNISSIKFLKQESQR